MTSPQHLHIVSFNVPWPADYGGVVDVYYRVRTLATMGVKVHLHCYTYGRKPAKELEALCEEVCYYRRETLPHHLLSPKPYIVASRCSQQLLRRLRQDNYPILLEGLHNGWLLERLDTTQRLVMLRAHNVEHEYYARLSTVERRPFKRRYLSMDARKLERYEPLMLKASAGLAVTEADVAHFRSIGCRQVVYMPSSHPMDEVVSQEGLGNYVLFHGDLSVAENTDAVGYLAEKVMAGSDYRLIVAGRNPSPRLYAYKRITIVANPTDERMEQLIREAQVNILFTQQATGLKLKLLHSLYSGRHCLVNSKMVAGTALSEACTIADTPDAMRQALDMLMGTPFTESDIEARRRHLGTLYSNASNAQSIIGLMERG